MNKHTPGPLSVRPHFGSWYRIVTSEGYPIGSARGRQNAVLYAAAPEMLRALERAEYELSPLIHLLRVAGFNHESRTAAANRDAMRDAIAKARGAALAESEGGDA